MSQIPWYYLTVKDLQPPFTYYWVSGNHKVWKVVVVSIHKEGDRWVTKVEPRGLDFSLAEYEGRMVIPYSGSPNPWDPLFNNYWVALAYALKLRDKNAA